MQQKVSFVSIGIDVVILQIYVDSVANWTLFDKTLDGLVVTKGVNQIALCFNQLEFHCFKCFSFFVFVPFRLQFVERELRSSDANKVIINGK